MYDLVVLGGGAGGSRLALKAARAGVRVALVEKAYLSGELGWSALVPSKVLTRAARLVRLVQTAERFGLRVPTPEVDFTAVMAHARSVSRSLSLSHSEEVLCARGVEVFRGEPAFEAYDTIVLDGRTRLSAQRFVIATGSRPAIPQIPGLSEVGYLDPESVWTLAELPETLVIVGSGTTAVEFAQAFARLGSKVKLLAEADRILPDEDSETASALAELLEAEGIVIKTGVELTRASVRDGAKVVAFRDRATRDTFEAAGSHILIAGPRLANVDGLNLEMIGVRADPAHGLDVDDYLQTHSPRVLAIGDVLLRNQSAQAVECEADAVFQTAVARAPKKVDYTTIPRATFTDPELASVGKTEAEAHAANADVRVLRAPFAELDRARIDGRVEGFAKLVTSSSGAILGVSILGEAASLVIQEFVVAMERGLTLSDLAATPRIVPTYAGVVRDLADQCARTRGEPGLVRSALRWFRGGPTQANSRSRQDESSRSVDGHGH
jgi:pyruvate/2-oxoglutarate dehydrogenase complex dihydrolipoamide dehydrogenase (E3) component